MLLFMRKTVIFLFLLTCTSLMLTAQNDWKNGFIIQNNGDTIQGYLDNRDSKSNAQKCYFKPDLEETTQEFTPSDLKGYRFIDGKFYISKTVKEIDPNTPIFLECILISNLNLYYSKYEAPHYFIEKDSTLYALNETQNENTRYKGSLLYIMNDAPINMNTQIQNTSLNKSSLSKLIIHYNNSFSNDTPIVFYPTKSNLKQTTYGIYGGISRNFINFGNLTESDAEFSYLIGLKVDFGKIFNKIENLHLNSGLELQYLSNYTLYTTSNRGTSKIYYNGELYVLDNSAWNNVISDESVDINLKTSFLKIPLSLNYYLSKGNVKPYIGAGGLALLAITQNSSLQYESFVDEYGKSIPPFQLGYIINMGLQVQINENHSLFTDITFEQNQSVNKEETLRFHAMGLMLKLGYIF